MQDKIVSTKEAAEIVGVKVQTLRIWRSTGDGPEYIRLGRGPRSPAGYRMSAIERWLSERTFSRVSEEQ